MQIFADTFNFTHFFSIHLPLHFLIRRNMLEMLSLTHSLTHPLAHSIGISLTYGAAIAYALRVVKCSYRRLTETGCFMRICARVYACVIVCLCVRACHPYVSASLSFFLFCFALLPLLLNVNDLTINLKNVSYLVFDYIRAHFVQINGDTKFFFHSSHLSSDQTQALTTHGHIMYYFHSFVEKFRRS